MDIEEEKVVRKKNNLNTKFLPPLFMLVAGLIAVIKSIMNGFNTREMLITVLISMVVFVILGTIVKSIVDSFNMSISYEDFLEDEGEVREK